MKLHKSLLFFLIYSVSLFFSGAEVFSSSEKQPVKLGFVGTLTGRLSDLGTAGRNGVILAVEEVNIEDGINSRMIILITRNDKNDPEVALNADRELIDEGVVAIIGHMTSSMSMAAVPLINSEKIVMISPTTSTDELTGIDDFFFRVIPSNKPETDHLSTYIFDQKCLKRMAVIYDLSNQAFSERVYLNFRESLENMGGEITGVETFTSGVPESFFSLVKQLLAPEPGCIFIIAGALDTAMICQQVRKIGSDVLMVFSGWAMTPDLIDNGGPAAEGIIFSQTINDESQNENFLRFKNDYENRFGSKPSFAAIYGYEAARVIINALSIDDSKEKLKDTIIKNNEFQGLQTIFRIDRYGDVHRKRFIVTIRNGQFGVLEQFI